MQIYRHGPIGVSKLRTKYGGKKNRGHKPEHFYKGSGSVARKVLQQFETITVGIILIGQGVLFIRKGMTFFNLFLME